jgi:DNA transposition AAA+ family ATPase
MKTEIAPVKNIKRLKTLGLTLMEQPDSLPGIAVCHGDSGIGKSTGLTWLCTTELDACYVRAMQVWTPKSLLHTVAKELDVAPASSNDETTTRIVSALAASGRPLIVDEADYVVDQTKLLNTLRDLHDLSTVPLILVGMGDFVKKLRARRDQVQFSRRVALELEFTALDFDDMRVMADSLVEGTRVEDDLVKVLLQQTGGNTREAAIGLAKIERHARRAGLDRISAKHWGDKPLHLLAGTNRSAA